jgi:hypothetical protein
MKNILNLTIVITTVGEKSLLAVIKNINLTTSRPKKILVVIYKKNIKKINKRILSTYDNVEIVQTNLPGQVNQRVEGFKLVRTDYAMQIDADCFIEYLSIKKMMNFLKTRRNVSVGPCFLDIKNNLPIHKLNNNHKFFKTLKNLILGFPNDNSIMGKVSKTGTNFGVDYFYLKKKAIQVDWIPGGCLMHHKKNLYLKNYYPFQGKAYYEDLIHSKILIQKNIKLFIIKDAICKTDFPIFPKKFKEFIKYIVSYNYSSKIYNVSIIRKYICITLYFIRYCKSRIY